MQERTRGHKGAIFKKDGLFFPPPPPPPPPEATKDCNILSPPLRRVKVAISLPGKVLSGEGCPKQIVASFSSWEEEGARKEEEEKNAETSQHQSTVLASRVRRVFG